MSLLSVWYKIPLYVDFIVKNSKTTDYFFYNYLKSKCGDKVTLCYTNTDSLFLYIFSENVYNDIKENL